MHKGTIFVSVCNVLATINICKVSVDIMLLFVTLLFEHVDSYACFSVKQGFACFVFIAILSVSSISLYCLTMAVAVRALYYDKSNS